MWKIGDTFSIKWSKSNSYETECEQCLDYSKNQTYVVSQWVLDHYTPESESEQSKQKDYLEKGVKQ